MEKKRAKAQQVSNLNSHYVEQAVNDQKYSAGKCKNIITKLIRDKNENF